jgi:hypothetical protein
MGPQAASENVIGLLLDDSILVPGAEDTQAKDLGTPGFLERIDLLAEMMLRISGMADTILTAQDKTIIDTYKHLVCRLPAKGYGILEFELTPERMAPILKSGEAAMETHFQTYYADQKPG